MFMRLLRSDHLPWIFVISLLGSCAIGLGPIFVRWSETGPISSGFYRLFFALPFLLMMHLRRPHQNPGAVRQVKANPWDGKYFPIFAVAGFIFAVDIALWNYSATRTTVAHSTLLANLSSVFVACIEWFVFGQVITRSFLAGMVSALIGTALMVGYHWGYQTDMVVGDMCALLASFVFGLYMLFIQKLRQVFSTATTMFFLYLFTCGALALFAGWFGEDFWPDTLGGLGILLLYSLVTIVLGNGLVYYSMGFLRPSLIAVGMLVQPATATLVAWLVLGETLSPQQFLGFGLVLMGLMLAQEMTHPKKDKS